MARQQKRFTRPANDDDLINPLDTVDALGWLGGNIQGRSLLCLAAGGGRQSAIYATAGAKVTVVDISTEMLRVDRLVAEQRRLDVQTVEASMDHMPMFENGQFDIVIHPVSTCYVPNIKRVYSEVARVTSPGGIYISQHKQPVSLQADVRSSRSGYELIEPYYRSGPLPRVVGSRHREEGTLEFLHRWEQLLGGLCRVGFVIEDVVEPLHADSEANDGSFEHRSQYVAPYVRIKARRTDVQPDLGKTESRQSDLWVPP